MNSKLLVTVLLVATVTGITIATMTEVEAPAPKIKSFVILSDTDDSGCESGGSPASEWCPDDNKNVFNITDVEIEDTSFVSVHLDGQANNSGCNVIDIGEDWFIVSCAQAVTDNVELYYDIVE